MLRGFVGRSLRLLLGLMVSVAGVAMTHGTVEIAQWLRSESARYSMRGVCTVRGSAVSSSLNDVGDTTYHPIVAYELVHRGQTYAGGRVDIASLGSSDSSAAEAVLERYPAGARVPCFFDPRDPNDLVLTKQGIRLDWALPIALLLAGLGVIIDSLTGRDTTRTHTAWRARLQRDGALVLTPRSWWFWSALFSGLVSWTVGAAALKMFTVAWTRGATDNGVAGVILAGFAGLYCAEFFRALLLAIGPRVTLTLARPSVPLGETIWLRWRVRGWTTLNAVSIALVGLEEATYTRGSDALTDRARFTSRELVHVAPRGTTAEGRARVEPPAHSMYSVDTGSNRIVWLITLTVDVDWWPDIDAEYELTVEPWRGKAP